MIWLVPFYIGLVHLSAALASIPRRQGVALAKAGDLEAAVPYYDQALRLDPSNADALVARGAALANRQQWQRASGGCPWQRQ